MHGWFITYPLDAMWWVLHAGRLTSKTSNPGRFLVACASGIGVGKAMNQGDISYLTDVVPLSITYYYCYCRRKQPSQPSYSGPGYLFRVVCIQNSNVKSQRHIHARCRPWSKCSSSFQSSSRNVPLHFFFSVFADWRALVVCNLSLVCWGSRDRNVTSVENMRACMQQSVGLSASFDWRMP